LITRGKVPLPKNDLSKGVISFSNTNPDFAVMQESRMFQNLDRKKFVSFDYV
jgi:hypothetical protein